MHPPARTATPAVIVRRTTSDDFPAIIDLCRAVYADGVPWNARQLASHLEVFPEGQLVAVDPADGRVRGMAASLIVLWDDYDFDVPWRDITDGGTFRNHDPVHGRTLYGAEVMTHPSVRGRGFGRALYAARRELVRSLGLLRIRAGARLRGYARHADTLTAQQYVRRVVRVELHDPTLSFQLAQGFRVLGVVADYLRHDPESLGWAAVIEWLNPDVATEADDAGRDRTFGEHAASGD